VIFQKIVNDNMDTYNQRTKRRENIKRNMAFKQVFKDFSWLTTKNTQPNGPKNLIQDIAGPTKQ
jgi:hypothetical protein